jgi:hypothetical protein
MGCDGAMRATVVDASGLGEFSKTTKAVGWSLGTLFLPCA